MSAATFAAPAEGAPPERTQDPYRLGRGAGGDDESTGHGAGGPSPKHIVVGYGFWILSSPISSPSPRCLPPTPS